MGLYIYILYIYICMYIYICIIYTYTYIIPYIYVYIYIYIYINIFYGSNVCNKGPHLRSSPALLVLPQHFSDLSFYTQLFTADLSKCEDRVDGIVLCDGNKNEDLTSKTW